MQFLTYADNKSNFHTSVQPEASRNSSVEKQTVVIIAKSVNSAKCERTMWFRIEWPDSIYISFGWEIFHCAKAIPPQRRGGEGMTFATTLVLFQVHSSTVSFQRGIACLSKFQIEEIHGTIHKLTFCFTTPMHILQFRQE